MAPVTTALTRTSSAIIRSGSSVVAVTNRKLTSGEGKDKSKYRMTKYDAVTKFGVKTRLPRPDIIRDPRLNKGMAFTLQERQYLGIHGLLPPAFMTQDQQAHRVMENLRRQPHDLARYVQLNALQDRNEKLFYRVICDNVEQLMPIVYTPTVGQACQKFGFIYRRPKGLYISIHDSNVDHIYEMLCNWPEDDVRAIVVTDGERILGLGDLGAHGMGIPIGKLSLYVALAGVHPQWCLPVQLDVGTNNERLLNDPFYIGLRHKRIRGEQYDRFVDNFMTAVVRRYGQDTLVQFEDFSADNAFKFIMRYRENYCMFNDDIQGTAAVVVAGLFGGMRIAKTNLRNNRFLFFGAGGAASGAAALLNTAMQEQGMSEAEALSRIYMYDINGLLVKSRTDLTSLNRMFAQYHDEEPCNNLLEAVKRIEPTALIGAATVGGAFTEEIIREMGQKNERPIIFALSNPTANSECTAEQAYGLTEGRAVFCSGSPFPSWTAPDGRQFFPGQGNNAYIFPGVSLAAILFGIRHLTRDHFYIAAKTLAELVSDEHLLEGRVYPPLKDVREISVRIAIEIGEFCYQQGTAATYPEPEDKEAFIRAQVYSTAYEDFSPKIYDWSDYNPQYMGESQNEGTPGVIS